MAFSDRTIVVRQTGSTAGSISSGPELIRVRSRRYSLFGSLPAAPWTSRLRKGRYR